MSNLIWPLVSTIVGLLMFALASNGKIVDIGKIMFAVGFAILLWMGTHGGIRL